jgi:hypothetical protein
MAEKESMLKDPPPVFRQCIRSLHEDIDELVIARGLSIPDYLADGLSAVEQAELSRN